MIQRAALEDSVAFEVEVRPTIAQCADIVEFNLAVFSRDH